MPPIELLIGGIVFASLTLYALLGGADFGGGVWDLFAMGPRAKEQRALIAKTIGPIWEANHVWLILVIVVMFICFPLAFSTISIVLHIPLTIMLIGIVLRGSSFVFRAYDSKRDDIQRRWSRIFAISSVLTPVMLGTCVGAIASGKIRVDVASGTASVGFFETWLNLFAFSVGLLTLALFAFLAAIYITLEAKNEALRKDFRRRALVAGVMVFLTGFTALALSYGGAPPLWEGLTSHIWSIPLHLMTSAAALTAFIALILRRYRLARIAAVIQVALIINGWGLSQYPNVIAPDLNVFEIAAPHAVLWPIFWIIGTGAIFLVPAFGILYTVFDKLHLD